MSSCFRGNQGQETFNERVNLQNSLWRLQNPFPVDCVSSYLNIPHMTIADSFSLNKISHITPDPLSADISIYYEGSVSNFPIPHDPQQDILQTYDAPNNYYTIMRDKPVSEIEKIVYCSRCHDVIICYYKNGFFCSFCSINNRVYYYRRPARFKSVLITCFNEHQQFMVIHWVYLCDWIHSLHSITWNPFTLFESVIMGKLQAAWVILEVY